MGKETIRFVAAGFHCVDIILRGKEIRTSLGGTAANVAAILSCLNQDVSFICPDYSSEWGQWIVHELKNREIEILNFSKTSNPPPRIIEELNFDGQHQFFSVCPKCGKMLSRLSLPSKKQISKEIITSTTGSNLFIFDRFSPGIKEILTNGCSNWTFFEPNACRNYLQFLDVAKKSNIIKFSSNRIHTAYIKRLKKDLQVSDTQIVISTHASKGFSFLFRDSNGILSDWKMVKAMYTDSEVDNTGAGDWFTAVFLLLFVQKYREHSDYIDLDYLLEIFETAKRIAALKCGYLGVHSIFQEKEASNEIANLLNVKLRVVPENDLEWGFGCSFCGL